MEFWFFATGEYSTLKKFEAQMQSQLFNWKGTNSKGYPMNQEVYGGLEPIQLYRYVAPKEASSIILKTLKGDVEHPQVPKSAIWAFQKALGLKPIPKFDLNVKLPVKTDDLQIIPVGVREDLIREFPDTGVTHEAL